MFTVPIVIIYINKYKDYFNLDYNFLMFSKKNCDQQNLGSASLQTNDWEPLYQNVFEIMFCIYSLSHYYISKCC